MLALMQETRYQYIIVMDMDSIQYSYPYESGLHKPYKANGEADVLNKGMAYVSIDSNELISAIRAFVPIYYENEQVGAVLVGLLTTEAKEENRVHVIIMEITLIFGVLIGMIMAILFSIHIKKSTFGLEPKEIAILMTEKDMIFQNIERGIMAVNRDQTITLFNKKSSRFTECSIFTRKKISMISPPLICQNLYQPLRRKDPSNIMNHAFLKKVMTYFLIFVQ